MNKNFWCQAKKIFSRRQTDKNKWEPKPGRDWAVLISLFFLSLLVIFGSFAFLYFNFVGLEKSRAISTNATSGGERTELKAALQEFNNKEERFTQLQTRPVIVDPSL